MNLKRQIIKLLKITKEDVDANDYYHAKFFGESNSVEYSIDGITKSHCKVTDWANGEGYDISFDTDSKERINIQLHVDEIDCLMACLMHFKYFGE